MQTDDILKMINKKIIKDGEKTKLSCSSAFQIASELDIKLGQIGKVCNEKNIRICDCQLGCFIKGGGKM